MNTEGKPKPNRLILENSPYLLQHAYNPVEWFAWSSEAFGKANKEKKLIFLSIGYSTCHWCHVMEKESFEDEEVAKILNEQFISIKVDREERPDIDSIYMSVCQALTGSGGWPLTIIMTPDKKPIFAGTYFPKKILIDMLTKINTLWQQNSAKLQQNAEQITNEIKNYLEKLQGNENLDKDIITDTYRKLEARYDKEWGGFGTAPKFPTPHILLFLLRYWYRTKDEKALEMVENTLLKMRFGGIYDHIGYGFHRYSTDNRWFVPHFEKMIYDQALLAIVYSEVYVITKKKFYKQVVDEIFTYVFRDMTSPDGAFYTAEDADSEGEEGKFYLWTVDEVKRVLSKDDANFFIETFNILEEGNFRQHNEATNTKKNILYLQNPLEKEIESQFNSIREKLFEVRGKRIHPHKDDKILTDWNGLMIAALSIASRYLGDYRYAEKAKIAADFILDKMDNKRGGLLHCFRKGVAKIDGFLDDYSFFVWGLLELYQATFNIKYLKEAIRLTDYKLQHFWDKKFGGMFLTSDNAEEHIIRSKDGYDGAIPSGNSIALLDLLYLYHITSDKRYLERVEELINTFSSEIKRYSLGFTQFLVGVDFLLNTSYQIVISGVKDAQDTKLLIDALNTQFIPPKIVLFRDSETADDLISIAPYTRKQEMIQNKATVYVCKNFSCTLPTNDVQEMLAILGK